MVEALKKIDKKILIIAGIVLLLPIVLIIFLAIIQGCSGQKITHDKYEEKMLAAAQNYFSDNGSLPSEEGKTDTVKLSKLVESKYIKSTNDLVGDDSCEGSVTVRRNGTIIEKNEGGYLNYIVNLECDNYKTNSLIDSLMVDLVTEGSGLYEDNGYYVYKGDEVKNYIQFFGVNYRIININKDGIVKLIKTESESLDRYWDNKYNIEAGDIYGINTYADSEILKNMLEDYNNFKNSEKKHIVAVDVCIDSKDINDNTINDYSCVNVLENQVVTLINVNDFAKASLDSNCTSIYSRSCGNYNYMKKLNLQSWTTNAVSNNTYQVYYLTSSIVKFQEASKYQNYNLVIHIDGNEKIVSGKGTEAEPYVIE